MSSNKAEIKSKYIMFRLWLENKLDSEQRQEAKHIADVIIKAIEDASVAANGKQDYSNKGIQQASRDVIYGRQVVNETLPYEYKIGEFLPQYPKLRLKFVNQAGFGKNKHLGTYNSGVIEIAIPYRTLVSGNYVNYPYDLSGKRIDRVKFPSTVVKWLKKPDVYNTLVHEIIHFLDGKRTKGKIWKNYPYEDGKIAINDRYWTHPSEYNANLQAFLVGADKTLSFQEQLNLIKKKYWFKKLNDNLKRNVIKRLAQYYESP